MTYSPNCLFRDSRWLTLLQTTLYFPLPLANHASQIAPLFKGGVLQAHLLILGMCSLNRTRQNGFHGEQTKRQSC